MNKRLSWLKSMMLIRTTEEAVAQWVENGLARTPCHLYIGQEAVAVGACAVLEREDQIWGNHRSHGHYLAKGGDLKTMMAEILCRSAGCAKGRGGSMHLISKQNGILGTVPIVGATVPLSIGGALALKMKGTRSVSAAFFGDGCVEEGHVGESMNMAAIYRLPVIFIVENNLYSSHMHISERRVKDNIVEMASLYGMPGSVVDGNDIGAVAFIMEQAVHRARTGGGPSLVECRTFRWRGHVGHRMDIDVGLNRKGELSEWLPRCPIKRLQQILLSEGVAQSVLDALAQEVAHEVAEAVAWAEAAPYPAPLSLMEHVYTGGRS
jgi:pyruvate dehydrogenase E1 component alpha subunit